MDNIPKITEDINKHELSQKFHEKSVREEVFDRIDWEGGVTEQELLDEIETVIDERTPNKGPTAA